MVNDAHGHTGRLRDSWLLGRREWFQFLVGYVVLVAVGVGIGTATVKPGRRNAVTRADDRLANWLVDHRTPRLDSLTMFGSYLAETVTKVVVTALIVVVMSKLWHRWFEPLVVAGALVLEACVFITVSVVVDRPRPDVPALDDSPVSSSFPSGHTAAAAAYGALVVVLAWRFRRRIINYVGWAIVAVVTVIVGVSRMYRGMHHLSDVVFGALLGAVCVVVVSVIVKGALVRRTHAEQTLSSTQVPRRVAGPARG